MDVIDNIFRKYAGKTIEMDFTDPNSDWSELIVDLEEYLPNDQVVEFMASGDVESYLDDYNITLMEPISDPEVDPDVVKRGSAKIEIDRMRKIAGLPPLDDPASLNEEKEDPKPLGEMLTFNDEETRNEAIMWMNNMDNYPKEVRKHVGSRLYYRPEDASSILFPTMENVKKCNIDERTLRGLVEIMHRATNKKFPNSKTEKYDR